MASCDPVDLIQRGSCYLCYSEKQLMVGLIQGICDLISGGGVSPGGGGVVEVDADPVAAPAAGVILAVNRVNSSLWYWDSTLLVWIPLII